ncbi:hypothetical protein FB446DRAFT_848768 [Lentinula raphanica]|nr:hypothetical protein FB446DRAFT_848768 [Lentinula raphanica]
MSPTTTQGPPSPRFEGFTENVVGVEETKLTEEMYELPPLRSLDISKGIPRYILDPKRDSITKALDLLPSFRPFYKLARSPIIRQRRDEALRIAATGLQRPELSQLIPAPRRLFKTIFPRQLVALNTLLMQHLVGTSVSGTFLNEDASISSAPVESVYTLDSDGYRQLSYAFQQLVQAARPSFRLLGKRLPDLLYWGDFGEVGSEFYSANDFEIICIAYRAQVEHFLTRLADVHDFQTNGIQDDTELAKKHDQIFGEGAFKSTHPANGYSEPSGRDSISNVVRRNRLLQTTNTKAATARSHVLSSTTALPPRSTNHLRDVFPSFNFHSTTNQRDRDNKPILGNNPGDGPSEPSDSEDDDNGLPPHRTPPEPTNTASRISAAPPMTTADEEQFDMRLKQDIIPTWDGNLDTIICWIKHVNDLAKRSERLCQQLGSIVPRRLEGSAQAWYYSLPLARRDYLETDWVLLRDKIAGYFMNRRWMESMRRKANRASYREAGYTQETPSEYYIRKSELLTTVYELADSEIISEVMEGAPANWSTILSTKDYNTVLDFQSAIKFYEEILLDLNRKPTPSYQGSNRDRSNLPFTNRSYLVGTRTDLLPPPFPRDDSNVSSCRTPKDQGARPCRHCGSDLHWDPKCKYSKRRMARARLCETFADNLFTQDEYEELYEGSSDMVEGQDFEEALRITERSTYVAQQSAPEGVNAETLPPPCTSSSSYTVQISSQTATKGNTEILTSRSSDGEESSTTLRAMR